jgi:hypothetical protein
LTIKILPVVFGPNFMHNLQRKKPFLPKWRFIKWIPDGCHLKHQHVAEVGRDVGGQGEQGAAIGTSQTFRLA